MQTCFNSLSQRRNCRPLKLRKNGENNGCDAAAENASFILNTPTKRSKDFTTGAAAEKSLSPSDHVLLCENVLGIGHVQGSMKGFYMEMKNYE